MRIHRRKICVLLAAVAAAAALLPGCTKGGKNPDPSTKVELPQNNGGKHPSAYTWEEYQAMDEAQKEAFRKSFGSDTIFKAWAEMAQRPGETESAPELPWEQGGKQPDAYSWEEFLALSGELQIAFQRSFESMDDFEAWMEKVIPVETLPKQETPWENGGKAPEAYTWEEFVALSIDMQIAFQNSFESKAAFDAWFMAHEPVQTEPAQTQPTEELPWEQGQKQPKDYTWAEFMAMSADQQIVFQNSFESAAEFDAWLEKNLPSETEPAARRPWENGGKQPEDYTWAEFDALSGELQIAFQLSFAKIEDFEAWMQRVRP